MDEDELILRERAGDDSVRLRIGEVTVYARSSNSWRRGSGSSDVFSNLEEGEWVEMDYVK